MIVTRSWLSEWINLDEISTQDLCKTFNEIGLEVDSVKTYEVPQKIVFGKVLECEKHPDADKLSVCKVDIGTSIRQIVCGASNVRAGLDVVVATVGAAMPSGMAIKAVKLRGVESEGMICSSSEIGLEDTGKGIMEIDSSIGKYELGQEVSTNHIFCDDIIEIELTANRGDCLSIRGVARDLSAAYDRPVKEKVIDDKEDKKVGIGRLLNLKHDKDLNVNLEYKAFEMNSLNLPFVIKLRLAQIDEKRETDIESMLFYATHATGVILRAYNFNFLCDETDEVKAKIELKKDENGFSSIMSEDKRVSTVGIKQEEISKVDYDNGIVLLEASYIPPDIISKKMQECKIESGPMYYKTSRGSEPELDKGLFFVLKMIEKNSSSSFFGGTMGVSDTYVDKLITLSNKDIDDIIGAKIDKQRVNKILRNLGFNTSKSSSDGFVISVPRYRHDILNKQDIVEEIVRMVGIDNIPSKPFKLTEHNQLKDDYFSYKKKTIYRHKAAQSSFNESIHFVFDEKKILEKYGFDVVDSSKELLNPIVNTLDTLRTTLLTGLLKATSSNVKNGYSSVRLFELGSVFNNNREESLKMAFVFSGDVSKESLSNLGKPSKIDFAAFVQKISDVIGAFELKEVETRHSLSHPFQSASIVQNSEVIGELFKLNPTVQDEYGLEDTFLCELDFSKLGFELKCAKPTSKYQASFRDLSVIAPSVMKYETIKAVIEKNESQELIRFYPVDKYSDETLGDNVSISIRFMLRSDEKTLEEEDITSVMDSILEALNSELGIGLR